ncbi:MAG: antibiotic biosynthesis monooxygenase [Flavobacteriaceae bacterium]
MTKHVQKDPYYAVIFTSKQAENTKGYEEIAKKMDELVKTQKGFIGVDSIKDGKNGITVSYWDSLENIRAWSMNERHAEAKKGGKEQWYDSFTVRICKVEREYAFGK